MIYFKQKINFKKGLKILLVAIPLFLGSSCSKKQKNIDSSSTDTEREIYDDYGGEKAYIKSKKGKCVHIEKSVEFYGSSSLSSNMVDAINNACKKASDATGLKVTFSKYSTSSKYNNAKFKITTANYGTTKYADTSASYENSGKVTNATIKYNSEAIEKNGVTKNEMYTIFLHEIGHVLGLIDYYKNGYIPSDNNYPYLNVPLDVAKKSVMNGLIESDTPSFTDYTKLDKANIAYYYE